jgi:RNA polymerase sigma factor (sigma-70 family)
MVILSDAAVIARSIEDPDAFGEIFDRYYEQIRRFAVSRLGPTNGPEVASQTFVTAFRRRGDYDPAYPDCKYWLYGIALNHIRSLSRRARRAADRELLAAMRQPVEDHGPEAEVVDRIDAVEEAERVRRALSSLSAKLREPLELLCWEELSYEEIADLLGVPVGTVRSRISRARGRIRELTGLGGQSSVERRTT